MPPWRHEHAEAACGESLQDRSLYSMMLYTQISYSLECKTLRPPHEQAGLVRHQTLLNAAQPLSTISGVHAAVRD